MNGPANHPPVISTPVLAFSGSGDVPGTGQLGASDPDVGQTVSFSIVPASVSGLCAITIDPVRLLARAAG